VISGPDWRFECSQQRPDHLPIKERQMNVIHALATIGLVFSTAQVVAADLNPARHGGQQRNTSSYMLELVAKDEELTLYVNDRNGNASATSDIAVSAIVHNSKRDKKVKLAAQGDGVFKGAGRFYVAHGTRVLISITSAGSTEQVQFLPTEK